MSRGLLIFTYILGLGGILMVSVVAVKIAREDPRCKKPIIHMAILAGVELLLALCLSADWVKDVPRLLEFADLIGRLVPVVGNFDQIAHYPEGTRVFLAITVCLLPLKVFLFGVCAYIKWDTIDEQRPWRDVLFFVVGTILIIYVMLTFDNRPDPGYRGVGAFWRAGMEWGGVLLWFSWSIWQLGTITFLLSVTLLLIWRKCVTLFHKQDVK
jgi:hypothetical protein